MSGKRAETVRRLFDAALERGPDSLTPFLEAACGDDASLRKEVEVLLAAHRASGDFLRRSALGLSAAEVASAVLDGADPAAVEWRVGAYRIVREIGRGGMGTVYLAERDDGEFEQRVAIKVLNPFNSHDAVARRFDKERQILAALNHPNVARLMDGGSTEAGLPYFVMEYVEGQRIDRYCNSKRLNLRARLELFRAVCEAVAYAHRSSVIHRDLKPSNILVNDGGLPKLLDFGIAKVVGPTAPADDSTATVFRALTPEYASPEQLRGGSASARSDIYSLGVLLCELLTGRRPQSLAGMSPYEVVRVVCEEEPRPPSALVAAGARTEWGEMGGSSAKSLRRRLAGDIDQIVLKALRKEPERRYASVEDLSEDLHRYLQGLPVVARKDSFAYRCSKFVRRNSAALGAALTAAALCVLLAVALGLFPRRPAAKTSIAVLPIINTSSDPQSEYLSDGVTEFLLDRLSGAYELAVPGHDSVFRFKGQVVEPREVGRALNVGKVLTGGFYTDGESIAVKLQLRDAPTNLPIWDGQYVGRPSEIMTMQQEMARDLAEELGLQTPDGPRGRMSYLPKMEAYRLYLQGRFFWNKRAPADVRGALRFFQQAIEADPGYALAYSGAADCYTLLGIYGELPPREAYREAASAAARAVEIDGGLAEAHASLAAVKWLYEWDWEGADSEFRRAAELNPNYATAHHWYGLYLAEMNRPGEALAQERRALELDPLSPVITADLGRVLYYARRYGEALRQYERALAIDRQSGGSADVTYVYEQLGMMDEWFAVLDRLYMVDDPALKVAYLRGGMRGFWLKRLDLIKKMPIHSYYFEAEVSARVGLKDRAFEMLDKAYEAREHAMAQLRVNPVLDPLRDDPRFAEMLRRMNLSL